MSLKKCRLLSRTLSCAAILVLSIAPGQGQETLVVAKSNLRVDLDTGEIASKGEVGQCIEKVAGSSSNRLLVFKNPGDDRSSIQLNGIPQILQPPGEGTSRTSGLQLTRDGSLFHVRTWKSGRKTTELVENGKIVLSWPRGTTVRILRIQADDVLLLVTEPGQRGKILEHKRDTSGVVDSKAAEIAEFESCSPGAIRIRGDQMLLQMLCRPDSGSTLRSLDLSTGKYQQLMVSERGDMLFAPIDRKGISKSMIPVMEVSGTPGALHFFHAISGLLLSQTGESRACSSDAEGAQSWNQSYRLHALAMLYDKVKHPALAALARKSISLTLQAQNGPKRRVDTSNPACAWGSTIYSKNADSRLSLMINQAVIANALTNGCSLLKEECPSLLRNKIAATNACLADAFEPQFDKTQGLYRIREDISFRHQGAIAPWNWQVSFAALLTNMTDPRLKARAKLIASRFAREWDFSEGKALWHYWPDAYYREQGPAGAKLKAKRYEDTGHAGISLLAMDAFPHVLSSLDRKAVRATLDDVLANGFEIPRDIDGRGQSSIRWLPAAGWANFSNTKMSNVYSGSVPRAQTPDAVLAYASLFDPGGAFQLSIALSNCAETCRPTKVYEYSDTQAFMENNPFFKFSPKSAGN